MGASDSILEFEAFLDTQIYPNTERAVRADNVTDSIRTLLVLLTDKYLWAFKDVEGFAVDTTSWTPISGFNTVTKRPDESALEVPIALDLTTGRITCPVPVTLDFKLQLQVEYSTARSVRFAIRRSGTQFVGWEEIVKGEGVADPQTINLGGTFSLMPQHYAEFVMQSIGGTATVDFIGGGIFLATRVRSTPYQDYPEP